MRRRFTRYSSSYVKANSSASKTWPSSDFWETFIGFNVYDNDAFYEARELYLRDIEADALDELEMSFEMTGFAPDVLVMFNDIDDASFLGEIDYQEFSDAEVELAMNSSSKEKYKYEFKEYILDSLGL